MSATNSLVNDTMAASTRGEPEPAVGMGATLLLWTDRHAATVTAWDPKTRIVTVTRDEARRADKNGMSEDQQYVFTSKPDGHAYHFRKDPSGRWRGGSINPATKRWVHAGSMGLGLGYRSEYHDFSF